MTQLLMASTSLEPIPRRRQASLTILSPSHTETDASTADFGPSLNTMQPAQVMPTTLEPVGTLRVNENISITIDIVVNRNVPLHAVVACVEGIEARTGLLGELPGSPGAAELVVTGVDLRKMLGADIINFIVGMSVLPIRSRDANLAFDFERLYGLDASGRVDDAIDLVYEGLLALLETHKVDAIGDIMNRVDVDRLGVEANLAFLAITVPAARRIPHRPWLVERVRARLVAIQGGEETKRLLFGLT